MKPVITGRPATPFGEFLATRKDVPAKKISFYLYWVSLFRNRPNPGDKEDEPAELERFLEDLGRIKQPWQVKQAQEAVRLYLYFRSIRPEQGPAAESAPAEAAKPEDLAAWDAMEEEMVRVLRIKHLALATERTYLVWLRQFRQWYKERAPQSVTSADVRNFLSYLAVKRHVASVTQNQAFNSLLFFMRHCLKQDPTDLDGSVRAPVRRRLPVVLSRDEITRITTRLNYPCKLMAQMAYGCGLRLRECLSLRIKDVDFERGVLIVRAGKGDKDRQTVLPLSLREAWQEHLKEVRRLYDQDRANGLAGVELPNALSHKFPKAGTEWAWFWAFPAPSPLPDYRTGILCRPHFNPEHFQRQFHDAVRAAEIPKYASVHTLRHNAELRIMPNGSCMLNTIPLQAA